MSRYKEPGLHKLHKNFVFKDVSGFRKGRRGSVQLNYVTDFRQDIQHNFRG